MQDRYNRCPNCMQGLPAMDDVCPYCGFGIAAYEEKPNCLRPFTVLQNKYMIGRVIGIGGFGITYIGWDMNLQTYIAIKEYYPDSLATRDLSNTLTQVIPNESKKEVYDKGLKRYVEEAQNLSKFYQLQGIVSVKDFFYENGTGYIVMEYINGINLKEYLNSAGGRLDEATVLALMKPVLESLYQIHNSGLVHRDISPDNIMVDKDNKIKLIDFGSARGQSTETDKTYTVILKHGYAPAEQYYAKGNQGPWTDIYSLCATMYKMLTGQIPPNSVERMEQDEYANPTAIGVPVSQRTELVLRKGLAVKVTDRYQNIGELLQDLYGNSSLEGLIGDNNAMPYSGVGVAVNSSITMQSMHLDMSKTSDKPKLNKQLIIGIIAGVAVLAIIIALVLIFGGDDDKTTEASTTEITTTEATTETTEEPEEDGYSYVAPTELSSDWRDYTISIDGAIYQFPMPYDEFVKQGWDSQQLPTKLASGQYEDVLFYNDTMEIDVAITNFNLTEAPINQCFVVGISISPEYNEISDTSQIELAGGIKWMKSTEDDIRKAYGAPDSRMDGTDFNGNSYVRLDYEGDESDDGMDFQINGDGVLREINIGNTALPEGYEVDAGDISNVPPEINSYYVAPQGQSTDRFDDIITIDGFSVVLPVPVSEFLANGWMLDSEMDDFISGNSSDEFYMEKEGSKIYVVVENFTSDTILPVNGYIVDIDVESDYCNFETIFPGGVKLGDEQSVFQELYKDLGDDYDIMESSMLISNYVNYNGEEKDVSVTCFSDPESQKIYRLRYGIRIDSIKQ